MRLVTSSHAAHVFDVLVYTVLKPLYSYTYLDTIDFSFLLATAFSLFMVIKYWHSFHTLFLKYLRCHTY
jgi:hypothetical protein